MVSLKDKLRKSLLSFERVSYIEEEFPGSGVLDCSLGQNPCGFPVDILKELDIGSLGMDSYPDPYHRDLRRALVEYWNGRFKEEDVFIGAGSMGCLERINKALLRDGSFVLGYSPQFAEYVTEVRVSGGIYEGVPLLEEEDFKFNAERFLSRLSDKYTAVYIDNPNNPTGQVISLEVIKEIARRALEIGVVVLIDEAYGDYMGEENSAINLDYPNVIVIRSFSKGFGLAGLRVGYAVVKGEELNELYAKVNLPFSISSFSERVALKALKYGGFLERSRDVIKGSKQKIVSALKALGFRVFHTEMKVPIFLVSKEGADLYEFFKSKGILCVSGNGFPGLSSSYVRIRVPSDPAPFLERLGFVI